MADLSLDIFFVPDYKVVKISAVVIRQPYIPIFVVTVVICVCRAVTLWQPVTPWQPVKLWQSKTYPNVFCKTYPIPISSDWFGYNKRYDSFPRYFG